MASLQRLIVALSLALLLAGTVGVITHGSGRSRDTRTGAAPTTVPATLVSPPATIPPPGPPGADSATLEAGMITPTDMGGYYQVRPADGATLLGTGCLAVTGPGPGPGRSGYALTALLGPDSHSLPMIVEAVSSYPAASAARQYGAVVAALGGCPSVTFDFGGTTVVTRLAPEQIAPVGDADQAWAGTFSFDGGACHMQVGTVLDGSDLITVVWIDSVPGGDPVMGSFVSTLSLAIGKLA